MRVDAGGKETGDRTWTGVRDSEFTTRGWTVAQRAVSVPAAKTVLGEVAERTEVFVIEGDPASRFFAVARPQRSPLFGDGCIGGLDPWIERIFHSNLALFK